MTGISSATETSTGGATSVERYDVFISYSRKDVVFARALEKALRSYRPPRDLGLPDRHLRVFRDEADFTGGEYSEAIRRHLGAARKLIVLSSPAARASHYVDEEVRLFAEHRGTASIVPVLLSGIPNNEAGAGVAADLAFPESLCRVMPVPLAADYRGFDPAKPRPNRGAYESAWFKLLADIYDVPRSTIAQREKRRQAATRRRWIAGTAAVMISLIALTVWALISRAEAIRQGEIAAAGLVSAQARMLNGPETEVVERQALLAIEAIRRLHDRGASTEEAEAVLSTALERLPQRIRTFPTQSETPVMAFSGDGLRMFRVAGNRIEDWNLRLNAVAKTIDVSAPVTRLDASPDAQWLAAVDRSGGVTLHFVGEPWATRQHAEIAPRTLGLSGSLCGAFSSDGALYGTLARGAKASYEIVVWRTDTGDVVDRASVGEVATDDSEPRIRPRLSFSPPSTRFSMSGPPLAVLTTFAGKGGRSMAVARSVVARPGEARSIHRWDNVVGAAFGDSDRVVMTRAGETIEQGTLLSVSLDGWKETARPLARIGSVSPDGRRLTTFRGTVEDPYITSMSGISFEIRDSTDGGVQFELASGGRFSADGNRYLTVSDRLLRIFDLDKREEAIRLRAARSIASVVDSSGGRYVAVQLDDRSIELWDTGHPLELVRAGSAQAVTLNARGRFAIVKASGEMRLLDVANGRMVTRLTSSGIFSMGMGPVVSPDGTRAVIDAGIGDRLLIDLTRPGRTLWRGKLSKNNGVFSPDGKVIVVPDSNELVRGVDAESGAPLWELPASWVDSITFGAAGNSVVIAGASETVLLDAATGRLHQRIKSRTSAAVWDGTRLAAAADDKFTVAGASSGQPAIELAHPATMSDVASVAFLPDGRRVATIAGHKEYVEGSFLVPGQFSEVAAFVWDIGSRALLARVPSGSDRASNYEETLREDEKAYMAQAVLTRDGRALGATLFRDRREYWTVLASNARKDAVVWDLTGTLPRETWRRSSAELAGLSDDGEVAAVLTSHSAQVWSLVRRDLAQAACARVSRDLDASEWKAYFGDNPYHATCNKNAGR